MLSKLAAVPIYMPSISGSPDRSRILFAVAPPSERTAFSKIAKP